MTTLAQIHRIANERHKLWLAANHRPLSEAERNRISSITAELHGLWDQLRRERACEHYGGARRVQQRREHYDGLNKTKESDSDFAYRADLIIAKSWGGPMLHAMREGTPALPGNTTRCGKTLIDGIGPKNLCTSIRKWAIFSPDDEWLSVKISVCKVCSRYMPKRYRKDTARKKAER